MPLLIDKQTSEPASVWYGNTAVRTVYRGNDRIWPPRLSRLRPLKSRDGLGGALIDESDRTLWVAGNNGHGCLGLGHTGDVSQFTLVPNNALWADVRIGYFTSWGVKTNGTAWFAGQAGYGNSLPAGDYTNWTMLPGLSGIKSLAKGGTNGRVVFFISNSGNVWGGGQMVSLAPQLPSVSGIVDISSVINNVEQIDGSLENMIVLKKGGGVWTSGQNQNGMCGNGTSVASDFQQIMTGAKQVVACYEFFTVLKTDGTVWWCGQCPDGVTRTTFTQASISNVASIHGNHRAIFLIKNNGELWNIGYNSYGEFGVGTNDRTYTSFVRTPDLLVDDIGGGYCVNYIKTKDGRIMSAGRNAHGERAGGGAATFRDVTDVWT